MPRTRRRRTSRFLDAGRPLIRVPARTALAAGVAACALLAVGALEPMLAALVEERRLSAQQIARLKEILEAKDVEAKRSKSE